MKKIDFDYNIKELKKYTNYRKNIFKHFPKQLIADFVARLFLFCGVLLLTSSIVLSLLAVLAVFIVIFPFQSEVLKKFQNDCYYDKVSAEDILDDLELDVLNDNKLTKNDLIQSFDYVKSTSTKKELVETLGKIKSKRKVIDYCMLSEKDKMFILRQIIDNIKVNNDNYLNINTYVLDDDDMLKEQFIRYDENIDNNILNKDNVIVKKMVKNRK